MAQFFSYSHEPALNATVGDFVSCRIWGEPGRFGPYCSMGVFDDETLIGGIIYHNYDPEAGVIELSAGSAKTHWMTRSIVRQFMTMPFAVLGCQSVFARHSSDCRHLRRIWSRFGAEEYVIPRMRGRNRPPECIAVVTQEAWAASPFMAHGTEE